MFLWWYQVLHKKPAFFQYEKVCFASKNLRKQRQLKFARLIITTPTKLLEAEVVHSFVSRDEVAVPIAVPALV